MVKVTINKTGAAFEEAQGAHEAARILREAADKLERGFITGKLYDVNGNGCGRLEVDPNADA